MVRLRERVDLGRVRAPDLRCGYPGPGGFYFVNYERAEDAAAPTTIWNGLVTSLQFGTSMLGWGHSLLLAGALGALFLGLMAASGLALVWVCAILARGSPPGHRPDAFLGGRPPLREPWPGREESGSLPVT